MLYYLHELSESIFGPFRIFESIPFRATMAFLTCFVLSLLLGERVIRRLISRKVGQPIRTEAEVHKLHELHGGKAGTPTMGGIMILGTTLLSTILWCKPLNPFIHALVGIMLLTGAIGFVDDYIKVKRRKSDGMSARFKLLAQVGSAALVGAFLAYHPDVGSFIRQLYIPFFDEPILVDMGVLAIPLFVLVIVGASNAVNLTDGLDGLAAGCTITSVGSFGVLAYMGATSLIAEYLSIPESALLGEVAIFCAGLVGATTGFLWFNCHPARVFMGDTGSLAIGGTLGTISIVTCQEFLLVIIGGVFVMEAMSVILQVGSFKLTGKRIFRMAPIHHHFELRGWHENQVILRFWMLSVILAVIGFATLKIR